MNRRQSIQTMAAAAAALLAGRGALWATTGKTQMTVYKSPTCGCCESWVRHMRAAGYIVKEVDVDDVTPFKTRQGVPSDLVSCHTGVVGQYAFEGHVPADLIDRFLKSPPKNARGLAVPGMPLGSPGMEVAGRKDAYDVVLFEKSGARRVFAKR
jgi:hypothetical protein